MEEKRKEIYREIHDLIENANEALGSIPYAVDELIDRAGAYIDLAQNLVISLENEEEDSQE